MFVYIHIGHITKYYQVGLTMKPTSICFQPKQAFQTQLCFPFPTHHHTKRLRLCFAYICMQASHASLHRMLLCIARLSARHASRLCSAGCCSVTLASPPCMSPSPHALGLVSSPFCMALLAFAELSCFAPLVLPCIVFSQ